MRTTVYVLTVFCFFPHFVLRGYTGVLQHIHICTNYASNHCSRAVVLTTHNFKMLFANFYWNYGLEKPNH